MLFGVLFFRNHAWMLGVRLIHECGLYTSLYGTCGKHRVPECHKWLQSLTADWTWGIADSPKLFEVTQVRRQSFLFFSHITRHSYHRMCQSIVLEWSCMILSGFRKVLIGNMIVMWLQSGYRVKRMHICILMSISCFRTTWNSM